MISNAYSYYLSQYGNRNASKYNNTPRKPSDVKRAYSKLLQINRTSPAYKLDLSTDAQKYAIDLKENARELSDIAEELTSSDGSDMVIKQKAVSDNPDVVTAEYIGDKDSSNVQSFDVTVQQLATPQVNVGNYLPPNSTYIQPGEYSFDLNTSGITYEFQFGVNEDDTSKSIQERLARLINRSNVGLSAEVLTDKMGSTALELTSKSTGLSGLKRTSFDITDNEAADSGRESSIQTLGLNRVSQYPSNAIYTIDGNQYSSPTNYVTINNSFSLVFHQEQDEPPVAISLAADADAVVDSINELVGSYNNLINVATDSTKSIFSGSEKLKRQFNSITHAFGTMLSSSGLDVSDNGSITVNSDVIKDLAKNDSISNIFDSLGSFKNAIQDTAERIAMDPMDYANNKIIAYKNPHRITTDPYNTSAYSGMLFNGYI
jgi:flagellar hook-associated protein 2